jgi:DNA-binding CsgD family transcriptional regulator
MVMDQLAASNPGFGGLAAAADHCNGLLHANAVALDRAAHLYPQPWAAGSADEDAAAIVASGDRAGSRHRLERALVAYERAGTARDADRVRQRLRRHAGPGRAGHRPVDGWGSLTNTEERVALVVADGLTNAEAAGQLYLSRHTVDFHLRHVFRKLGITSRVELARLAAFRQANGAAWFPIIDTGGAG